MTAQSLRLSPVLLQRWYTDYFAGYSSKAFCPLGHWRLGIRTSRSSGALRVQDLVLLKKGRKLSVLLGLAQNWLEIDFLRHEGGHSFDLLKLESHAQSMQQQGEEDEPQEKEAGLIFGGFCQSTTSCFREARKRRRARTRRMSYLHLNGFRADMADVHEAWCTVAASCISSP